MISPQDLKRNAFNKAIKGYAPGEVDEYISFLLSRYNEAYAEYAELERKYQAALSRLDEAKSEESTISATIVNAQKMADMIVNDAKEKANEIKSSVSESCDRILEVYRTKVAAERDKLAECEDAVAGFKDALYDAYKKHIAMIDSIMPDSEPTPYLTDDELEDKALELAENMLSPEAKSELSNINASEIAEAGAAE